MVWDRCKDQCILYLLIRHVWDIFLQWWDRWVWHLSWHVKSILSSANGGQMCKHCIVQCPSDVSYGLVRRLRISPWSLRPLISLPLLPDLIKLWPNVQAIFLLLAIGTGRATFTWSLRPRIIYCPVTVGSQTCRGLWVGTIDRKRNLGPREICA